MMEMTRMTMMMTRQEARIRLAETSDDGWMLRFIALFSCLDVFIIWMFLLFSCYLDVLLFCYVLFSYLDILLFYCYLFLLF